MEKPYPGRKLIPDEVLSRMERSRNLTAMRSARKSPEDPDSGPAIALSVTERTTMLILLILLLLIFGGGGGYWGYSHWGFGGGAGILLVVILLVVLLGRGRI
jgi:hypothetical protein